MPPWRSPVLLLATSEMRQPPACLLSLQATWNRMHLYSRYQEKRTAKGTKELEGLAQARDYHSLWLVTVRFIFFLRSHLQTALYDLSSKLKKNDKFVVLTANRFLLLKHWHLALRTRNLFRPSTLLLLRRICRFRRRALASITPLYSQQTHLPHLLLPSFLSKCKRARQRRCRWELLRPRPLFLDSPLQARC